MSLTALHLLLTHQCNWECDHCFVWGSPTQSGVMSSAQIEDILAQARIVGTIEGIYFEGGEPFLHYPVLVKGVQRAAELGFKVGLVTNAYWATNLDDARLWLTPFAGLVHYIAASSDLYHCSTPVNPLPGFAEQAAQELGIPTGVITVAQPTSADARSVSSELPAGETTVQYRGRAAVRLADKARQSPWSTLDCCPYESLREPTRVHVDPSGELHVCQGISMGNLCTTPLADLCAAYDPAQHPILGPMVDGGPAELVRRYDVAHRESYADACHLCYEARVALRTRFPAILTPDQMYGIGSTS